VLPGAAAPRLAPFPGLAIFPAVLARHLVGGGFRDAFDPSAVQRAGFWA
jgi:ABC-type dipeptide/oligopeptide/nickel transport system permease subunit